MVFNGSFEIIILCILTIWLLGLSAALFRMIRHYKTLMYGSEKVDLIHVLEGLLRGQKRLNDEMAVLKSTLEDIKKDGRLHIQRIGLVRFNPFSDTGGSQSFTLALLDGRDNGLVMTSLYARTGHRWYVKEVAGGKGKELALSKEEQAAIKKAYA